LTIECSDKEGRTFGHDERSFREASSNALT